MPGTAKAINTGTGHGHVDAIGRGDAIPDHLNALAHWTTTISAVNLRALRQQQRTAIDRIDRFGQKARSVASQIGDDAGFQHAA
ncbi:hypothetical protein D3C73_1504170 [compost metagenome]